MRAFLPSQLDAAACNCNQAWLATVKPARSGLQHCFTAACRQHICTLPASEPSVVKSGNGWTAATFPKPLSEHSWLSLRTMRSGRTENLLAKRMLKRCCRRACLVSFVICIPCCRMSRAVVCSCGLAGTKCWRLPVCKSGLAKSLPSTRAAAGGSVGSAPCLSSLVGSGFAYTQAVCYWPISCSHQDPDAWMCRNAFTHVHMSHKHCAAYTARPSNNCLANLHDSMLFKCLCISHHQ